ncbi:MAG: hypothetical protein FJ096_20490 [Deltaproteobacteria bacterium]|nr:hypothetical protein [Deltaproteobacteria bacterium]
MSIHSSTRTTVTGLWTLLLLTLGSSPAQAQQSTCQGTKQWYQGECRWPKDIEKLKKEGAPSRGVPGATRPPASLPPAERPSRDERREEAERAAQAERELERKHQEAADDIERKRREAAAAIEQKQRQASEKLERDREDLEARARAQKAELEKLAKEQRAAADASACEAARRQGTPGAWKMYLEQYPEGRCAEEGRRAGDAASAERLPSPSKAPSEREVTDDPATPLPPSSRRSIAPLVTGLTLGTLAIGAGIVTGMMASAEVSQLADACPSKQCPPELRDQWERAGILADVSTYTLIGGGAAVAAGVVLQLVLPAPTTTPEVTALHVQPLLGPGWAGIRGVF